MKVYIRSTASISPQEITGDQPFLQDVKWYEKNVLKAIEPDYKKYIDPKLIRRMSRIIRMGVSAASQCLQNAGNLKPDAIITGTAYGCLEDTGVFLSRMIEQEEQMLSPTSFIQSTHNTVGAQIALMLQCTGYNNTFVHRSFSFESALLDSMMLLKEKRASLVLTGSADELTNDSLEILKRFDLFRKKEINSRDLLKSKDHGSLPGEGTSFFLLSNEDSPNAICTLDLVSTLYKPKTIDQIKAFIDGNLQSASISLNEIDLVITGRNGDEAHDENYNHIETDIFDSIPVGYFKHLSGEYPTAISFALWLGANIIQQGMVPEAVLSNKKLEKKPRKILIYNHYQRTHHSLILLTKHLQ